MNIRLFLLPILTILLYSCNSSNNDSPDIPDEELDQFVGYWTSDNNNSTDLLLWSDHSYTAPSSNVGGSESAGEWYYDSTTGYLTLTGYKAKTYIITHISTNSFSGINLKNQETVSFAREDYKAVDYSILGDWITEEGDYLNIGYHYLEGTLVPQKAGYVDISLLKKKLNIGWNEENSYFTYSVDYEDQKHYWHTISKIYCSGTFTLDNLFNRDKQTLTITGTLAGVYHRKTTE